MLLYGDSDIGKTMIIDKFVRDHSNICNEFGEVEARKVLRRQMPSKPNDCALYVQIIESLDHYSPYTRRGSESPWASIAASASAKDNDRRRGASPAGRHGA